MAKAIARDGPFSALVESYSAATKQAVKALTAAGLLRLHG
jgi:hypothetical protein